MIRLNKFLAQCGLGSRRKCDEIVQTGRIAVNGEIITELGYLIDENEDKVAYDGRPVSRNNSQIHILLNKPVGYITTLKDEWERKSVIDLIPIQQRIFPVGRLDKDTEGLLLLTNDGNLCYQLTHPKYNVEKVYQVTIDKDINDDDIKKLEQGLMLETGVTAPCKIEVQASGKAKRVLNIVLHEGKKRQIRKMFETLGYRVIRLIRFKFASLTLNNLPVGEWRYLTDSEIKNLKEILTNASEFDTNQ